MMNSNLVVSAFSELAQCQQYQRQWWPDTGIISILENRFHFQDALKLTYQSFNRIMSLNKTLIPCPNDIIMSVDGSFRFLIVTPAGTTVVVIKKL